MRELSIDESNEDQTNLKIEFTEVTLADGEALRVKVDYQFLSEPTSPGIQLSPLTFSGLVPTTIRTQRIMGTMRAIWQTSVTGKPTPLQVPLNPVIMPSAKKPISMITST